MNDTVIPQKTFSWIQEIYKKDVLHLVLLAFTGKSYPTENDIEDTREMIERGKDLYLDFWAVVREKYGEKFTEEAKERYETFGKK